MRDEQPMANPTARMVELCSPESELEVLLFKSILEDAGLDYFVKNDAFGSLMPGPRIALCNGKTFLVAQDQLTEARQLLEELRRRTDPGPQPPRYSLGDKIRMVLELLMFGWIMPGRRRSASPPLRLVHSNDEPADLDPEGSDRPPLHVIRGDGEG